MSKILKDCCRFQEGYVNPSQENPNYFDGNINWLRTVDLNDGFIYDTSRKLTKLGFDSAGKSSFMFKKDTLAISKSGTIGTLGILKCETCGNRAVINIDVKKEQASLMYIFYLLKYKKNEILSKAVGSIQKNLYVSALETIALCHDDKIEQDKIANILSTIDQKIELNNKINAELETLLKTIYDYWFVQFEFPDENGKPYKSNGGKMEYNEQLKREIPDGWKVGKLQEFISRISTGLNPRDNFVLGNGNIKYVTVKNLNTNGSIDFINCDLIDEKAHQIVHARSDVTKGDLLFASIAPLGRCYFIQETPSEWDINESVFSIRPNYNKITSEFLYMFLTSDEFVYLSSNSSTGSIFKGIRIGVLSDMPFTYAGKEVINKFSDTISKILRAKYDKQKENQQLTALRDWLLPMLMNGQVSVE